MLEEGFLGGSDGKELAYNAGNPGLVPGLGRSPEEGNGYPYSSILARIFLPNSWTGEPGGGIVYGVAEFGKKIDLLVFLKVH